MLYNFKYSYDICNTNKPPKNIFDSYSFVLNKNILFRGLNYLDYN